jgi:hypothetical protein
MKVWRGGSDVRVWRPARQPVWRPALLQLRYFQGRSRFDFEGFAICAQGQAFGFAQDDKLNSIA